MPRPPAKDSDDRLIMPVNLEGLRFWLTIMQEHALFIRAFLPAENRELRDEAQRFYQAFGLLLTRAEKLQNGRKFRELACETEVLVRDFYRFKRRLLQLALVGDLGGALYPLFLDHISREAAYFLLLLQSVCAGNQPYGVMSRPEEVLFWVRIMGDHSDFIRQMLDPSEGSLICTAEEFSQEFDELYLQGTDYISMLRGGNVVPAFNRYAQDTRVATQRLRDFKRALYNMINEDRVLSIIPALLADHVRREADHFLLTLAMMEKNMAGCPDIAEDAALAGSIAQPVLVPELAVGVPVVPLATVTPGTPVVPVTTMAGMTPVIPVTSVTPTAPVTTTFGFPVNPLTTPVNPTIVVMTDDDDFDDDRVDDNAQPQASVFPSEPEPEPEPEPVPVKAQGGKSKKDEAPVATKAKADPAKKQYKWNSVWPNPLGLGKKK